MYCHYAASAPALHASDVQKLPRLMNCRFSASSPSLVCNTTTPCLPDNSFPSNPSHHPAFQSSSSFLMFSDKEISSRISPPLLSVITPLNAQRNISSPPFLPLPPFSFFRLMLSLLPSLSSPLPSSHQCTEKHLTGISHPHPPLSSCFFLLTYCKLWMMGQAIYRIGHNLASR